MTEEDPWYECASCGRRWPSWAAAQACARDDN